MATESYWSENDSYFNPTYYRFPPIIDRYAKKAFNKKGDGRYDWLEYLLANERFKDQAPFNNTLSLCCGFGHVDRSIVLNKLAKSVTGIDIAPGAIKFASDEAKRLKLNIDYYCEDINKFDGFKNKFDLVYASGALHHIKDLDQVLKKCKKAMNPGGLLIAYDKIGPNYCYPNKRELEVANSVLHLLPPELRGQFKSDNKKLSKSPISLLEKTIKKLINKRNEKIGTGRILFPIPPLYWKIKDPTEGISCENVEKSIKSNFKNVEVILLGGGILTYVIGGQFLKNYSDLKHGSLLNNLFEIEDLLSESGDIRVPDALIIASDKKL